MIDLHTHTIYSDGSLTVNDLIDNAVNNGVAVMSITDHDTTASLINYNDNHLRNDIIVIPGVEFSTDTYYLGKKTKIHLLGYGYSIGDKLINDVLNKLYERRCSDDKEYIEDLIKQFSYLSKEYFIGFNYGKTGWLFKRILNYISSHLTREQFESLRAYLVNNKPVYNKYNERVEDMISLMHNCNGYAVFAHPQKCDLSKEELNVLVKYLTDLGLDGIETYHIDAIPMDREKVHRVALEYGLYETGGSDFHSFQNCNGVGDPNINFPKDYDPFLVKRLIKEKKVLGDCDE